jgi:hypothetical protein
LGRTIRLALEASVEESTSGDENTRLADERTFALAQLARVKDRATFERGARLVNFDVRASGEILVTPPSRACSTQRSRMRVADEVRKLSETLLL